MYDTSKPGYKERLKKMSNELIKLSNATKALAEARTLDEVSKIRDIARAAEVYAKAAKLGEQAINSAIEIRLRAERKAGEMLVQMGFSRGGSKFREGTLKPLGIDKKQSSSWKKVASIPDKQFEASVSRAIGEGTKLSQAYILREYNKTKRKDSTKAARVSRLASGATREIYKDSMENIVPKLGYFDLIVADPPYNVTKIDWDDLGGREEFLSVTEEWINVCINALNDDYHMFWFCSPKYAADIEILFRDLGLPIQSRLIWHRKNMSMGSKARNKFVDSYEIILHVGTYELNFPDEWSDAWFDVQTFAVPQTNFKDQKVHPTQKPEALIRRIVEFGSFPGGRILDPFAGSGVTGAVCPSDRSCVLIEREEKYVKVIEEWLGQPRQESIK